MSLVVAIEYDKSVLIGSDSLAVSGDGEIRMRPHGKFFKTGKYLIEYVGYGRDAQLLEYGWEPPKNIQDFPETIRERLSDNGRLITTSGEDAIEGIASTFVVCHNRRIYELNADFELVVLSRNYSAIGSGNQFALGSLYTTQFSKSITPYDRLELALKAGAANCIFVGGEFHYDSI